MKTLQVEIRDKLLTDEAQRMEQILCKNNGINTVSISASGKLAVTWDNKKITKSDLIEAIENAGLHLVDSKNSDQHSHSKEDHHNHTSLQFLGENTELYFAIMSGIFWILGIILSFISGTSETLVTSLFVIGAISGGVFTFYSAGNGLLKGKFEIDFLMLIAAIGAAILGKWSESALLLFLFSLGHALEHYAMKRARKSISALSDLTPPTALLKQNGTLKEVHIEDLKVGDTIFKYGHDIGKVVKEIKKGEHVHVHNVKTKKW